MIQSLEDILLLVSIVAVGVVSFLLAILLYHLIFIVMDFRKIIHRVSHFSEQVEGMLTAPVAVLAEIFEWLQERVWDTYFGEEKRKKRNTRSKKTPNFSQRKV